MHGPTHGLNLCLGSAIACGVIRASACPRCISSLTVLCLSCCCCVACLSRADSPRTLDPLPDYIATRVSMSSASISSSASSAASSSQAPSQSPVHLRSPSTSVSVSASDPSTWPSSDRPVSPSVPLDTASAVYAWLDRNGARLIGEWLSENAHKLVPQHRQSSDSGPHGHDSAVVKMDTDEDQQQQQQHQQQPQGAGRSEEEKEHRALGLGSGGRRSVNASRAPTGDGDEFAEVDPRLMLASRNKMRIDNFQQQQQPPAAAAAHTATLGLHSAAAPASSSTSPSNSSSAFHHNAASRVDSIRDSPLAEAGATVQEHKQSPAVRQPATAAAGSRRAGASGPDVLLVEDVRVSQKLAQAALTRAHYKVEVASDGESAIEKYRQHAQSLRVILMDVGLPGISGTEAAERIRRLQQEVGSEPVLIYGLTGNVAESNLRQYEQAGMNGCIVKGKLLVDAVKQAVEMSERNPGEFVNITETAMASHGAAAAAAAARQQQQQSQPSNQPSDDNHMSDTPAGSSPPSVSAVSEQLQASRLSSASAQPTSAAPTVSNTQPSRAAAAFTRPAYQPGASGGVDLLLVEDVRVSQRVASQALQRINFRVEVASDGESAVEKYKALHHSLRVILMDVGLPGISGIDATERIRRAEREFGVQDDERVLIYGLTGNVDEENLREYEEVGMNGCIVKGRLIADAVRQALQESANRPGQFINMVRQQTDAAAASAPSIAATSAPTASAGGDQAPSNSRSPNQIGNSLQQRQAVADEDDEKLPIRNATALRALGASANASSNDAIGTPRAVHPRQLLRERYPGSGVTRPGMGLPSAGQETALVSPVAGSGVGGSSGNSNGELTAPSPGLGVRSTSAGLHGPEVLLVEDVRVSQKLAQQALQRAHYKVDVASDGESAVDKYRQHAAQLRIILMDVGLPGITGIEATERIRALEAARLTRGESDERRVMIFGLTGNVAENNLRQYEQAGMNGCIVKGQLLVDAVKQAVERVERNPDDFVNLSAADGAGSAVGRAR